MPLTSRLQFETFMQKGHNFWAENFSAFQISISTANFGVYFMLEAYFDM